MPALDWLSALDRTRRAAFDRIGVLLGATNDAPELWEHLEVALIQADLGPELAQSLTMELREEANDCRGRRSPELRTQLRERLLGRLQEPPAPTPDARPWVVLVVGVNGSGKTTAAARLAHRWRQAGHTVLLAGADTYRAAAGEQLGIWAERLGLPLVQGQPGGDAAAVVYDAAQSAKARGVDILVVDTSGRMHTRYNLMAELQKICRVAGKVVERAPHQVLLALDATTGQNGLAQASAFAQAVGVTGVILTKLDSSSKGGVGFAVSTTLGLPIEYVGVGQGADDLLPFEPRAFIDGLLADFQAAQTQP